MDRGSGRTVLLVLAGLLVLGLLGAWLVRTLLALAFYVLVGLVVVAVGMYLYSRVRAALRRPGRRQLPRR